jgi:hypothetical protein
MRSASEPHVSSLQHWGSTGSMSLANSDAPPVFAPEDFEEPPLGHEAHSETAMAAASRSPIPPQTPCSRGGGGGNGGGRGGSGAGPASPAPPQLQQSPAAHKRQRGRMHWLVRWAWPRGHKLERKTVGFESSDGSSSKNGIEAPGPARTVAGLEEPWGQTPLLSPQLPPLGKVHAANGFSRVADPHIPRSRLADSGASATHMHTQNAPPLITPSNDLPLNSGLPSPHTTPELWRHYTSGGSDDTTGQAAQEDSHASAGREKGKVGTQVLGSPDGVPALPLAFVGNRGRQQGAPTGGGEASTIPGSAVYPPSPPPSNPPTLRELLSAPREYNRGGPLGCDIRTHHMLCLRLLLQCKLEAKLLMFPTLSDRENVIVLSNTRDAIASFLQ